MKQELLLTCFLLLNLGTAQWLVNAFFQRPHLTNRNNFHFRNKDTDVNRLQHVKGWHPLKICNISGLENRNVLLTLLFMFSPVNLQKGQGTLLWGSNLRSQLHLSRHMKLMCWSVLLERSEWIVVELHRAEYSVAQSFDGILLGFLFPTWLTPVCISSGKTDRPQAFGEFSKVNS